MFTAIWIIAISSVWAVSMIISLSTAVYYEDCLNGGIFPKTSVYDFLLPLGNILLISFYVHKRKKEVILKINYEEQYFKLQKQLVISENKYHDLIDFLIQSEILTEEQIEDLLNSRKVLEKLS